MTIICSESRARDLIGSITPAQLIEVARVDDDVFAPASRPEQSLPATPGYAGIGRAEWIRSFESDDRAERRQQLAWNLALFLPFILLPILAIAVIL